MYRDEKIAARLVGRIGAGRKIVVQSLAQSGVALAGVDDLHVRQLLFEQRAQLQRNAQINVLLLHAAVHRARERLAAVTRVDDNNPHARFVIIACERVTREYENSGQNKQQTVNCTFHIKTVGNYR